MAEYNNIPLHWKVNEGIKSDLEVLCFFLTFSSQCKVNIPYICHIQLLWNLSSCRCCPERSFEELQNEKNGWGFKENNVIILGPCDLNLTIILCRVQSPSEKQKLICTIVNKMDIMPIATCCLPYTRSCLARRTGSYQVVYLLVKNETIVKIISHMNIPNWLPRID